MNRAKRKQLAKTIAANALSGVVDKLDRETQQDADLVDIAEAVTTQDPWWHSMRVYGALAAALSAIVGVFGLSLDEPQALEALWAAGTLAAIVLPMVSKAKDPRAPAS